ncbi:Putative alpha-L-fucosidase [Gryllus bimaculatus]|nr:Putative alpha-L-fucosidase [Gryllus bimaculatus]
MRRQCVWCILLIQLQIVVSQYKPTWESLDSRPLPQWYDEAKFGIFIHWGVFSVPSFGSEWFWENWKGVNSSTYVSFMKKNYPVDFTYQDFARYFSAEFYDPNAWANIFKKSGAKYIVLTSKHHEGYTLWPSKYSFSWNSMDVGPHRDLVGELAESIRSKTDLKFGLYHSMFEWFNPLYLHDKGNNFSTQLFVTSKTVPELHELVEKYQPAVIWSDGDWEASDSYWTSKEFLAWLYNKSPVKDHVVVNDRWGKNIPCKHGDFYTCTDHFNPGVLQPHKWENCMTIDKHSWGYRRNAELSDYRNTHDLLKELVTTVSCGGNLLLNVGPTKDGVIPVIMQERLQEIGSWLEINGEAIYSTRPWTSQNDSYTEGVWYTTSNGKTEENFVYAIVFEWPEEGRLSLAAPKLNKDSSISMLGTNFTLRWMETKTGIEVQFPDRAKAPNWMWCLKISKVENRYTPNVNLLI